jgi:hypothetical protein
MTNHIDQLKVHIDQLKVNNHKTTISSIGPPNTVRQNLANENALK